MPYGRTVLGTIGQDIQVIAGPDPVWKFAGCTLDWSTVAAVSGSDLTLPDGNIIKVGSKFLRYGQVLTRISNPTVMTLTDTGASAGSFKLSGTRRDTGATVTVTIAYNASVANVQTAMDTVFGVGNTVVSGAGALPTNTHTITFAAGMAFVTAPAMIADSTGLTGGTAVVTATNAGANTGMFGPYDPGASDGRQTLARDRIGILNRTVIQYGLLQAANLVMHNYDNPGLLVGGPLWKGRVIQSGVATHTLALGPTLAEVEANMPLIRWYGN